MIQTESRPHFSIELIARTIAAFAGSTPLANANRGKNSEDVEAEQQFERDPQTYHRGLRVATGLGILETSLRLEKRGFDEMGLPFGVFHGQSDRVTRWEGSQLLWDQSRTRKEDKMLCLYDGFEHIREFE